MRSIDDLARAITELDPSDRQALLDRVAKLDCPKSEDNGADIKFQAMQEAANDELFLADLSEVMDDFHFALMMPQTHGPFQIAPFPKRILAPSGGQSASRLSL